ncbi:MAG: hypothetical protein WBP45_02840, partial [Daejeonella sp.]
MEELGPINIDFLINNPEVAKAAEQVKAQIKGVDTTAIESSKKQDIAIKAVLNTHYKEIATIEELNKKLKQYQFIANNAFQVDGLNKYNKKIQETEAEIRRLNNAGKTGFDSMGNAISKASGLAGGLKTTLLGVFSALGIVSLITEVVQLGKELFGIAHQSEGIEIAFSRLNNPELLNKLRIATKGTVDDLKLMQTAVKANDFRIPMDVLAKGLAFAQKKARDTGKEVDYLVDSLIDGIGRKSVLKIDNLNISVIEVQKEFKKTGDFAVAVGNIIDREMEKSGESIDLFADKIGKTATVWQNFKTKTADFFRDFFNSEALDVNKATKKSQEILAMFTKANFKSADQAERDRLIKIAEDAVKKQTAVYLKAKKNFESSPGNSFADIQLSKASTDLLALQNVSAELKAQNKEILTKNRLSQGYLSIVELQAEAESKRDQASKIFPTDKSQTELRSRLIKEAEAIDAEIAEINGKSQKKRAKAEETAAARAARLNEQSKKAQEALQQRIADIDSEYARKSLNKNDQELQSVRDKFKKIAEEVQKFNADPKNRLHQVDGSSLNKTRDAAIADLTYRQETEKLKINLEEQKQLYADYETYKNQVGKENANKRFANEVDLTKTYLQKLEEVQSLTFAQGLAGGFDGKTQERLNLLSEGIAVETKVRKEARDKDYADAYQASLTLAQETERINAEYRKKAEDLRKGSPGQNVDAQIAELYQKRNAAVDAAKDEAFQKTTIYRELSEQIVEYTRKQLKAQVEALKTTLKLAKDLSPELRKSLEDQLVKANAALNISRNQSYINDLKARKKLIENVLATEKLSTEEYQKQREELAQINLLLNSQADGTAKKFNKISDSLSQVGGIFDDLSNAVGDTNKELAYTLSTIGSLAKIGSDAAGSVASFATGDIIGGISKGISAITGLFSIGKKTKEMNAAARKELDEFYAKASQGEREYQALLRERARQNANDHATNLKAIKEEQALLTSQTTDIQSQQEQLFAQLQGQQFIASETYKHGTWFRKAKTTQNLQGLAGMSYDQIEQLYTQSKLTEGAKALFEQLKKLKDEGVDVANALKEAAKQADELATGTNVDSLSDMII